MIASVLLFLASAVPLRAAPPSEPTSFDDLEFKPSETFGAETAEFFVDGHKAFLVKPTRPRADGSRPWIWYAPTLAQGDHGWTLPGQRHVQVIQPLLEAGCYFGGVDVGESYGSPAGRETFTAFHRLLSEDLGMDRQAMLFPVSRGGLMHYNWAAEHPGAVRCIGAIYPVCNLKSYPRLERAAKTYGIPPETIRQQLDRHSPVERLAPLAEKRVPLFHLHGDRDTVVPLAENSALLASRYRKLGGPIELVVIPGKGHEIVPEFWENPKLAEFFLKRVKPATQLDTKTCAHQARMLWRKTLKCLGDEPALSRVLQLPPSDDNPRNSEGDFVQLKDGRILLVYTHFTSGAADHATAYLAGRYSDDGGETWSDRDRVVVANEGQQNVMSVSLLRLQDGRIALFYIRKNSREDCRPCVRFSDDEARTWSEPIVCVPDEAMGYYVLNNDRVVQLRSGRLVMPLAQHHGAGWKEWTAYGVALCYLSDDGGRTWRRSRSEMDGRSDDGRRVRVQEPGIVELKDGRLMMFCRTDGGCQYLSYSEDGGDRWSPLAPSGIISPVSPATIERIPGSGELLLLWNNHDGIVPSLKGKRTPLTAAVSRDEGQTWQHVGNLETNPHGWYCYTAVAFVDEHVLLAYCAGDRRENNGLALLQVSRVPIGWFTGGER